MVIVRLWGGLGNQLFQYAFAYCRAKAINTDLILDLGFFDETNSRINKRFTKRNADIMEMNILEANSLMPTFLRKKVLFLQKKNINRLIRIPCYSSLHIGNGFKYVKESRYKYNSKYNEKIDNVYYDGYWQSESYFKPFRKQLIEQFIPKKISNSCLEISKRIESCNSIMLHIRRGDYVRKSFAFSNLYLLDEKYYHDSIAFISKTMDNPVFFVFSDDVDWAKERLSYLKNVFFVSGGNELTTLEEFYLMTKCKNHIVSNSTFSWWGAWLAESDNKIVLRPSKWFGNRDIFPKEWISIQVK